MSDSDTSLSDVRALVRQFVAERDWNQFHSPKNLSMAMAIEVSELMEHFQWITPEASRELAGDADKLSAVVEELADVFCYVLALANELNIDLSDAFHEKMVKNACKYPVDEFRGRF
jgi:NTP pyrophosphatase (non-canonical NTP hydrolase)